MEIEKLYKNFKDLLYDKSTVEHIFIGEINKRGLGVGFHHEGDLAKGLSEVIEETRLAEDSFGVYEANVIIRGVKKLSISSFFPKELVPNNVLKLIKEGYNNKKKIKAFLYEATLSNGIIIHFYERDNSGHAKIVTAYPKYQVTEMVSNE
jgi:hypothetical protein